MMLLPALAKSSYDIQYRAIMSKLRNKCRVRSFRVDPRTRGEGDKAELRPFYCRQPSLEALRRNVTNPQITDDNVRKMGNTAAIYWQLVGRIRLKVDCVCTIFVENCHLCCASTSRNSAGSFCHFISFSFQCCALFFCVLKNVHFRERGRMNLVFNLDCGRVANLMVFYILSAFVTTLKSNFSS